MLFIFSDDNILRWNQLVTVNRVEHYPKGKKTRHHLTGLWDSKKTVSFEWNDSRFLLDFVDKTFTNYTQFIVFTVPVKN